MKDPQVKGPPISILVRGSLIKMKPTPITVPNSTSLVLRDPCQWSSQFSFEGINEHVITLHWKLLFRLAGDLGDVVSQDNGHNPQGEAPLLGFQPRASPLGAEIHPWLLVTSGAIHGFKSSCLSALFFE